MPLSGSDEWREHVPEVALYAPLRLTVYEGNDGRTFVAYEHFTSQLAQYQREEIMHIAQLVEQKLEALSGVQDVLVHVEDAVPAAGDPIGEFDIP